MGRGHLSFSRERWAQLRGAAVGGLDELDLERLRGTNEPISVREVEEVYLPLTRLLSLLIQGQRAVSGDVDTFLGRAERPPPFILAIAGSVAVGKSTVARLLKELLAKSAAHARVELVTTDGFLLPNRELEARGLMHRKGFPESYDVRRLVRFVADVKAGRATAAPVYSHLHYDVLPDATSPIVHPDVLVIEGLNVLQLSHHKSTLLSDFFDFSIYVDAAEENIERWYLARFMLLRRTAFADRSSYFHHFASLSPAELEARGREIWRTINALNLRENIAPTRERADLIIEKGPTHAVTYLHLRRQ